MNRVRTLILGAAGRDFHNFNTYFDEADLERLVKELHVDEAVFSYSDVPHEYVMHRASQVMAAGANFRMLGPDATMIRSTKPVIAVCAVRTGAGKSQTSRRVVGILRQLGERVVSIRHPMPYGDLAAQRVQRFATYADLDRHQCTIEEREEYEPHIDLGAVIYAGVDYEAILREADKEADVIVWDGGNNDFSFYKADLYITVADPHRPGHELTYHPGEANLRLADVVINKVDTASPEGVATVRRSIERVNPMACVIDAASPIFVSGAGVVAARKYGAAELVDPRPFAVRSIAETYAKYPNTGLVLPAMGYGEAQMHDLEATINVCDCDLVISATPIDLTPVIHPDKPLLRVGYELQAIGQPTLEHVLREHFSLTSAAADEPRLASDSGRPGCSGLLRVVYPCVDSFPKPATISVK